MKDITVILHAVSDGDVNAESELLRRVYDELHLIAERRLRKEPRNITLQTTDLVHETYLRLFSKTPPSFKNRRHFFAAAAEAMRRILIERARKRLSERSGGKVDRIDVQISNLLLHPSNDTKLLRIDEALEQLENLDAEKAELVKLRFFTGMTIKEASEALGISASKAERQWRFIRNWLQSKLVDESSN